MRPPGSSSTGRPSTPTASTRASGASSPSRSPTTRSRSSSSACSAAMRAASASPTRPRSYARRCCSGRTRSRRVTRALDVETVELADRVPQPGRAAARARSRLGRSKRRSGTARASGSAARRRGPCVVRRDPPTTGAEALAAAGLEPIRLAAKEGLSLINGTQFMASMATLALVRAPATRPDRRPRLRTLARVAPGLADELPPRNPPGPAAARADRLCRRTSSDCSKGRRSSSRIAGATRCRTPTRCGARRRCTVPAAICSTTSRRPSRSS